jgi:hypothetical protein
MKRLPGQGGHVFRETIFADVRLTPERRAAPVDRPTGKYYCAW